MLDAGQGFVEYLWQDESTEQTFTVTETGYYNVTVTDENNCTGSDEVHVTILNPDYAITDILQPVTQCELSDNESVVVEITNLGDDTLDTGDEIPLILWLEDDLAASEILAINQTLDPNSTIQYTFNYQLDLSQPAVYKISAATDHPLDTNLENDRFDKNVEVYGNPVVNLGGDQESDSNFVILDAGDGFVEYVWQDGSTEQTYTVVEEGYYSVTVTDENGCNGFDEVYISFPSNIIVTEVLKPANEECRIPDMPIEVIIKNNKLVEISQGEQITITCVIDFDTPYEIVEEIELTDNLDAQEEFEYTFNKTVNLQPDNTYNFSFSVDYNNVEGSVFAHSSTINPTPNVNLGADTIYVDDESYTLVADVSGTYLWSTGSTEAQITVYDSGTFWVQVTNSYGCTASDTVYVDFDGTWTQQIPGTNTIVSVYPNPVNEKLTVQIDSQKPSNTEVQLISPVGQTIYQKKEWIEGLTTIQLDVTNFTPGVYLLRVMVDGGWTVTRVVVDK